MARLRKHTQYGTSINCRTFTPFEEIHVSENGEEATVNNGPTFTVHLFNTGTVNEGKKVCAFEVWQRDLEGTRYLVAEGMGFEAEDPTSTAAMVNLTAEIVGAVALENEKSQKFFEEYVTLVATEAKDRFRVKTPRPRKVKESTPVSVSPVYEEIQISA